MYIYLFIYSIYFIYNSSIVWCVYIFISPCCKYFSIIADEAADSSNKEQLSLVLRFVDENLNIREDFVGYVHCVEGLSGEKLASVILKTLSQLNLNINDCRGQGYDGAGAVAGKINGCSAHILRLNNKALYTHCFSHRLNLVMLLNTVHKKCI